MRSNVCTKSSSDGSKRRPCCRRLTLRQCCSGRCSPLDRSTCGKLTVGRRLQQSPSISQLTSLPDQVLSKCRRSRHPKFQHKSRRHLQRSPSSEKLDPPRWLVLATGFFSSVISPLQQIHCCAWSESKLP